MNDDFRLMIGRFVIGSKIVDRQSQMPELMMIWKSVLQSAFINRQSSMAVEAGK